MTTKMRKAPLIGNIVETKTIGGTTVHICDDCIVKTKEEVDAIISKFLRIGAAILREVQEKDTAAVAETQHRRTETEASSNDHSISL